MPEKEAIFIEAKEVDFKVIAIMDQLVSTISNQADLTLYGSRGVPWEFRSMVAPYFNFGNVSDLGGRT